MDLYIFIYSNQGDTGKKDTSHGTSYAEYIFLLITE